MKFLIDQNISEKVAEGLQELGHDAVTVGSYGLSTADDLIIFERAAEENRVVVSADTDFGTILAKRQESKLSIILFRLFSTNQRAEEQVALIKANLENIEVDLLEGSIVVIEPSQIRIRPLPIGGKREE
jgi:predicted nuclease of predicted toxin-antitoxin system